ncbi:MAG: 30S ribosomal protein S4e [Candidatus Aenigmatarchaeota archaeon]
MVRVAHLKRLVAPEYWPTHTRGYTWTYAPSPGPHKKDECIPLAIIVRDVLKLAETGKEAEKIIKAGEIKVDGKIRKDPRYPAGLLDVISIPKINKHYRIIPFKKGLKLIEIEESEANKKIVKILNKKSIKGGKTQLNLNDGKNIIVSDGKYKTHDSLLIELPTLKIMDHIKLENGVLVLITSGEKSGKIGKVTKIYEGKFNVKPKIECEIENQKTEVLKEYAICVGREKPMIKVVEYE